MGTSCKKTIVRINESETEVCIFKRSVFGKDEEAIRFKKESIIPVVMEDAGNNLGHKKSYFFNVFSDLEAVNSFRNNTSSNQAKNTNLQMEKIIFSIENWRFDSYIKEKFDWVCQLMTAIRNKPFSDEEEAAASQIKTV